MPQKLVKIYLKHN